MRLSGTPWLALLGLTACVLAGCGEEQAARVGWQTCTIIGLEDASGLAVHRDELVAVAGGDNRNIYAIPRSALGPGERAHARGLKVDVEESAFLQGAEVFSEQGYEMRHIWALPVDFQAVATRTPNLIFVGDRARRVVLWGRLLADVGGRLARVRFERLLVAPGATRSDADAGDWRDKGPGLSGLVAPGGPRTEDLFVVDRGEAGGRFLRIRKTDKYGSVLGGILLETSPEEDPQINALAWWNDEIVLQRGAGAGEERAYREISGAAALPLARRDSGPELPPGQAWSGMAFAADGTQYLVSDGKPARIAWRAPDRKQAP